MEGERLYDRRGLRQLQRIREWAGRTTTGDTAECGVPEDAMVWPLVTSSADNCLGTECPVVKDCHLLRARRRAQEAELLVVNHHLLFADMALKDEGFGELLPDADAFIMDEAHQLPEVASNFFGINFSARQIQELAGDSVNEQITEAPDLPAIRDSAEALETAIKDLRLAFGPDRRRAPWREVKDRPEMIAALAEVGKQLDELHQALDGAKDRSKGLESCHRRARELSTALTEIAGDTPEGYIHWFETYKVSFAINLTPLDVAGAVKEAMAAHKAAWIFTSATLAVGDDFGHFTSRMGLEQANGIRWESPFDFRHQAVLYVPTGLPAPRVPGYTAQLIDATLPVLEASQGRAFLLFTSHRALQEAAGLLRDRIDYPMLVQGESSRAVLLERFRELGNAVLLGTGSFWEGVDVRGEALSLVVIDKLPFASPGDPVVAARIEAMRRNGGVPFFDFQLPQAVIAMKQGIGRLIRDVSDRGVLMLCDPRLVDKAYGRTFLDSFPPMTKTRKLEVVQRFFKYCREGFP
jgi:ATP-dependent DNA helicase DinG